MIWNSVGNVVKLFCRTVSLFSLMNLDMEFHYAQKVKKEREIKTEKMKLI